MRRKRREGRVDKTRAEKVREGKGREKEERKEGTLVLWKI